MLVKLPRNCSGREIVEAFKVASTFEEKPGKKWEPKDFVDKIIYVPGSVKQVARDIGVCVHSFSLKKKWGLFGKKVWKLNHSPNFTLDPLDISHLHYRQIEVTIEYKDVFGDATERQIQRPKSQKRQRKLYSGKKKLHTMSSIK